MEPGDFTELASDYARYRTSYNQNVVKKILNLFADGRVI